MARRSADPDSCTRSSAGLRRSDRFLIGLHEAERVVLVSHINPDPDSLGSMLGLSHLVEARLGKPTLITRDGLVTRAENRAMVDVLNLDLLPIEEVDWRSTDAIVMVDSQPNTGRHSLAGKRLGVLRDFMIEATIADRDNFLGQLDVGNRNHALFCYSQRFKAVVSGADDTGDHGWFEFHHHVP